MLLKCFHQYKIFNRSVYVVWNNSLCHENQIKIWPKSLQLCFGVFGSVPAMEGGDCSKGKVWVRQTGLACCFLFLQLPLIVATLFTFTTSLFFTPCKDITTMEILTCLLKVTSLPHTAIQGIWRMKRLGVYFWSKMFPHKWQCLYRARASVCVWGDPKSNRLEEEKASETS